MRASYHERDTIPWGEYKHMYDLMAKLLNVIDSFEDRSASEVHIADYILRNIERIPEMSIYDLADACHISAATISRFVKKLGHDSFKDFKESCLSIDDFRENEINYEALKQQSDLISIKENYSMMIRSLEETRALVQSMDLDRIVSLLRQAEKIAFFGVGYSHFIAQDAQYKLTRLGKYCTAYSSQENQLKEARTLTERDVAFLITFSGETGFMVKLKEILKRRKISLIVLTSQPDSLSARGVDLILTVSPIQNKNFNSPVIQQLAMISVINVIYLSYVENRLSKA